MAQAGYARKEEALTPRPRHIVISEKRREEIREVAMNAAFEKNERRELPYTTEGLINAAIEAAIDKMEEMLA